MEDSCMSPRKDGQGKGSLHRLSKDMKLPEEISLDCSEHKSKRLVGLTKPKHLLKPSVKQSQTNEWCIAELYLRNTRGLNNRIPKHIVSLDEKYLRRCVEMIHNSAAKASTCSISVNLSSLPMGVSSKGFSSPKIRRTNILDSSRSAIECPLEVGTGDVVGSPVGQWIIGSITGNRSMINILKSSLFRQFGASENDVDFGKTSLTGVQGSFSDSMSSPGGLTICSSEKLDKDSVILGNYNHGLDAVHNRLKSISSTYTSRSDQTSSSAFAALSHGMLQCTWNCGIPHFVFYVDDRREIYVANLLKAESSDDKALDSMYLFHSGMRGKKEHEICTNESNLVGKMKVSTSFTLSKNNSRVMETEFVLFGALENHTGEMQTSSQHFRKNKALSKKVAKVFKSSLPPKHRSYSNFARISTLPDYCPWEPRHTRDNIDASDRSSLIDDCFLPNIELSAIVIKEHLHVNHQEAEVGGWGLNFLKKDGLKQTSPSQEASVPSECCLRNTGGCSTSMDIIIPAGIHGGPRTRNGGPSSLTERWRSGGHCDCGGWDIGCPLTVLNTISCKEEVLSQTDMHGDCKSFDLFIQGIEQGEPTMKMINIHDGLYFIHFQSILSALQSFSVAVAIIHTQSPQLQPKNV